MNDQVSNNQAPNSNMQSGNSVAGSNFIYKTVIGLFNSVDAAQTVVMELEKASINRNQIELVTRQAPQNSQLVPVSSDQNDYDRFFYSLFSSRSDAAANLEAAHNSNAIVAVYTNSPEQTQKASALLQEYNTANQTSIPTNVPASNEMVGAPGSNSQLSGTSSYNASAITIEANKPATSNVDNAMKNAEPNNIQTISQREMIREHKLTNSTNGVKDFTTFRPGIIELVEFTEVPVIKKVVRVVEEVSVQKIVEEHEGTIQDTVRRTEVDIQNINRNDLNSNR